MEDMQRQLTQMEEELAPYLEHAADGTPHITLDGLPFLIRRMAFNIPTTDIIENLACQVLHLAAIHEDYVVLEAEYAEVLKRISRLEEQAAVLEQENQTLSQRLTDLVNRGFWERLTALFSSQS